MPCAAAFTRVMATRQVVGALLEVAPGKFARHPGDELMEKWPGIVVVHELQRLAGYEAVEGGEDQRVALARGNGANVDVGYGLGHAGSCPLKVYFRYTYARDEVERGT